MFTPVFLVTTRSQFMAWLFGDVWWDDDAWHLFGMAGYSKSPTDFYGVGDDTPAAAVEDVTPGTTRLDLTLTRAVRPRLYVGPRVEWERTRILKQETGGLIASGAVPGAGGADLFGVGLVASYDTRDALMYPTRGWFASVGASRFLDILGGDFVYTRSVVDVRRYVSLGGTRVLALQAVGTSLDHGQAPFSQLVRLGLRGTFETRYLENDGVLAQVELRSVLWGRLGAAVFAGASELAARRDALRFDEARYAAGFGLRVRVGPDGPERVHIRLDYGFGKDDSGFYVNFGEAF
jgi:outer membrane protein assembly factor BamA